MSKIDIEECRRKSRQTDRTSYKKKKKYISPKKYFKSVAIAALIGASVMGSINYVTDADERMETAMYEEDTEDDIEQIHQVVSKACRKSTYIEYSEIADYINKTNDPDKAIFLLYESYGKSNISLYEGIVDSTLHYVQHDNNSLYRGLDDYLESHNFKDLDQYERVTKRRILNDIEMNAMQKEVSSVKNDNNETSARR